MVHLNRFLLLFLIVVGCKSIHPQEPKISEPHRPGFHFTPPQYWMNDPNGMVYYEGEYHLFYQYFPESTVWGPMHWGHAVSTDLVHWQHLPIALYPDSLGLIFSGSTVIDWNNTSGFGKGGKPPMVAIFTQHSMEGEKAGRNDFQCQSIAYSTDNGRTWTKYASNPVIPNTDKIRDFRDPKVIWHEVSKQWIMVFAAQNKVMFWSSPDLKRWTHLSNFGQEYGNHGGVWECPDFFPLQLDNTGKTKWVLLQSINPGAPNGGSGTQYFVGDFDGKTFTLDPDFAQNLSTFGIWLDSGRDNYAGVTWSDIPKADGRRIFMGWMSNWDYAQVVPTQSWRSANTIPRELQLRSTPKGPRLYSLPVKEMQKLRKSEAKTVKNLKVNSNIDLNEQIKVLPATMELQLAAELPAGFKGRFYVELFNDLGENFKVGYNAEQALWFTDRRHAGNMDFSQKFASESVAASLSPAQRTLKMHLFFDVASCELFAEDGAVVMTDIFFPTHDFSKIKLVSEDGTVLVRELSAWEIRYSP